MRDTLKAFVERKTHACHLNTNDEFSGVSHDERRRERGERYLRIVLRAVGRLQNHEGTLPAVADTTGGSGGGEHVSQTRMRQGDGCCQSRQE